EEAAALAYAAELVQSPDLARALQRCGAALAAAGVVDRGEEAVAASLMTHPVSQRLLRHAARHALAVRAEDLERPQQQPETAALMQLESAAVRAGDAWDRQVARKVIALQGQLPDGAAKRALL